MILPAHDRLQLYCGAVLQFPRGASAPMAPSTRRAKPRQRPISPARFGPRKPPPTFWRHLRRITDEREGFTDEQSTLQQLQHRLTDADLPELIRSLAAEDQPPAGPSLITSLISQLNWKACQTSLLQLAETNEAAVRPVAAILNQDGARSMPRGSAPISIAAAPRAGPSLPCARPRRHAQIVATLCHALRDPEEDVSWNAITSLREFAPPTPKPSPPSPPPGRNQ